MSVGGRVEIGPGQRSSMPRRSRYNPPPTVPEVTAAQAFGEITAADRLKAPPVLWAAGDTSLLAAPRRVSIVGSRDVSAEGARRARKLAWQLASAGVVIVSGLAKGIDRAPRGRRRRGRG